jgi:hypothetical protein
MAIEMVDLPMKNGDFPVHKLWIYQGVVPFSIHHPAFISLGDTTGEAKEVEQW